MKANRGVYSCGDCGEIGHTRKCCQKPTRRRVSDLFISSNAGYRENRKNGLCDACGVSSKRFAYCAKCRERKRKRPSRQNAYRMANRAKGRAW